MFTELETACIEQQRFDAQANQNVGDNWLMLGKDIAPH